MTPAESILAWLRAAPAPLSGEELARRLGCTRTAVRPDPLAKGDCYPGDLLASVLRVDAAFWKRSPDLEVELRKLTKELRQRTELEPGLRELIEIFIQDHSA